MRLQQEAIESALAAAGKRTAMPGSDPRGLKGDEVAVEYFPFVDSVPIVADQWTMLVAHEFFDALPIHVFEKTTKGWREVLVDINAPITGGTGLQSGVTTIKESDRGVNSKEADRIHAEKGSSFRYVLSSTETPWTRLLAASNPRFNALQPGQRVEVSPESWAAARKIGELVSGRPASVPRAAMKQLGHGEEVADRGETQRLLGSARGGAALIVDYGDEKAFEGSFRAFKSHAIVDPLKDPGTADLTANVDFACLKNALSTTDSRSLGPMFQAHFLMALGLMPRVDALVRANSESPEKASDIESAAKRLIESVGMGAQYKVLGIEGKQSGDGGKQAEPEADKIYPFDFEAELRASAHSEKGQTQAQQANIKT